MKTLEEKTVLLAELLKRLCAEHTPETAERLVKKYQKFNGWFKAIPGDKYDQIIEEAEKLLQEKPTNVE